MRLETIKRAGNAFTICVPCSDIFSSNPRFRTGCSGASSRRTPGRDHTIPDSLIRLLFATTPRLRTYIIEFALKIKRSTGIF